MYYIFNAEYWIDFFFEAFQPNHQLKISALIYILDCVFTLISFLSFAKRKKKEIHFSWLFITSFFMGQF